MDIGEGFGESDLGPRLMLVASNGGHLEQLWRLSRGATIHPDSLWVTFDSPQAHGLLNDQPHVFLPEIGQRDWVGATRAVPRFRQLLRAGSFDGVVSTGAGVAASAFAAAKSLRVRSRYIESVSRVSGPSVTGRLIATSRLADTLWTQHEPWAGGRWEFHGAVMDAFESFERAFVPEVERVFVSLGTLKRYPFPRAVENLRTVTDGVDVIWQLGVTPAPAGLHGEVHDFTTSVAFDRHALDADTVVSHAGVGSVLRLLEMGIFPILIVRRRARGEHIDDHQAQIAAVMRERGLALVREAGQVTLDDLAYAAARGVRPLREQGAQEVTSP